MVANFAFDSNNQTVRIITGFNGDEPIVDEVVINKDNAYLTSQEYGKYQALKFLYHLFTGSKNGVKYYDINTLMRDESVALKGHEGVVGDQRVGKARRLFLEGHIFNEAFYIVAIIFHNNSLKANLC